MAERTTTLKVKTEGLNDAVAQAERLDKLLSRLEVKANSSRKRTGAASSDAALSSIETGLNRGTAAGAVRGDSRDFARQAQGLGGLVHVYATFAANVFAVSAAFTALSKAADFSIMQKSADILSGQFGLALNNTAKGLRDITDGAISARQSLEMVNMGATAGLNTAQMEGLTKVAKGASLALGRDLTDAMNRVFKGAIKVEPELLDELGIMVKVAESSKEYARSLNKSALELTDFEKRQAFVNAVVKQGADKYSELTGQINPYTKLLASLSDVLMTAGQGLNTILTPIASFFASSTTALVGGLTLIASTLLGMAIPAIKAYGDVWKNQNAATKVAMEDHIKLIELKKKAAIEKGTPESRINKNKLEALGLQEGLDTVFKTKGVLTKGAVAGQYDAFIAASGEAGVVAGKKLIASLQTQLSGARSSLGKLMVDDKVTAQDPRLDQAKNRVKVISEMIAATASSVVALEANQARVSRDAQAELVKYNKDIDSLNKKIEFTNKISNIIQATENLGIVAGFKAMSVEVSKVDSSMDKWALRAKGSLGILTSSVAGIASKLGMVGMVIGVLAETFSLFMKWTGGITDRSDKLAKSVEALEESTKALHSSLEGLAKANSIDKIFTYNKAAASNALSTLQGIVKAQEDLAALQQKGGFFEKGWEKLTGSKQDSTADNTAKAVKDMMSSGALSKDFLKSNFGFEDQSKLRQNQAGTVERYTLTAEKQFSDWLKKSSANLEEVSKALESNKSRIETISNAYQNLEPTLKNLKNAATDYINSLMPQNLGGTLLKSVSSAFSDSLKIFDLTGDTSGIAKSVSAIGEATSLIGSQLTPNLLAASKMTEEATAQIKSSGVSLEGQASAIQAFTKAVYSPDLVREYVSYSADNITALKGMADQSAATAKALAGLSVSLRKIGALEGFFGATVSGTKKKQNLEDAQVSAQSNGVKAEIGVLTNYRKTQLESAGLTGANNSNDLLSKLSKTEDQKEANKLAAIFASLAQVDLAISSKQGQLAGIAAAYKTVTEKRLELANAKASEDTSDAEARATSAAKALESESKLLEARRKLGQVSEWDYNMSLAKLETTREEQDYLREITSLIIEQQKLQQGFATVKGSDRGDYQKKLDKAKEKIDDAAATRLSAMEARSATNAQVDAQNNILKLSSAYDTLGQKISLVSEIQDLAFGSDLKVSLESSSKLTSMYASQLANLSVQLQNVSKGKTSEEAEKAILEIELKRVALIREQVAIRKQDLETSLKLIELGKASPTGWGKAAAETLANTVDERMNAMVSSTKTFIEGTFTAVDSSIDKLGDLMQQANVNWKDMKASLKENFGNMLKNTLTNAMKNSFSNLMTESKKLFNFQSTTDKISPQLTATQANTAALGTLTTAITSSITSVTNNTTPKEGYGMSVAPSNKVWNSVTSSFKEGASDSKEASYGFSESSETFTASVLKSLKASDQTTEASTLQSSASKNFSTGVTQWGNAAFSFLGDLSTMLVASAGGGKNSQGKVFAMNLLNGVIAGVKAYASSPSTSQTTAEADYAKSFDTAGLGASFARGGIMTEYGPLQVQKYASGGIASSPQVAVYGEGRNAEAYVPLPDNRSIPVTMTGGGGNTNNIDISINIESTGNSTNSSSGAGSSDNSKQFANALSKQVSSIVQEEIAKATRPGGMLYNR